MVVSSLRRREKLHVHYSLINPNNPNNHTNLKLSLAVILRR